MPVIRANTGSLTWPGGHFRPRGKVRFVGPRVNPEDWSSKVTWAARLFVGFNVGDEERYTVDDLVKIVQVDPYFGGKPAASFVAQVGLYTSRTNGYTTRENGAQVIILNLAEKDDGSRYTVAQFRAVMVGLAERICDEMEQEEVIVEIQRNGIAREVIGVVP